VATSWIASADCWPQRWRISAPSQAEGRIILPDRTLTICMLYVQQCTQRCARPAFLGIELKPLLLIHRFQCDSARRRTAAFRRVFLWRDVRKQEAAEITEITHKEGLEAIQWCGGVYSSEWGACQAPPLAAA
jgi:hypothetical protein